MERYEKPNMEVVDIRDEVIVTSGCSPIDSCGGGFLGYGGPCSGVQGR